MQINLQKDYENKRLQEIKNSGLKFSGKNDDLNLIIQYSAYLRKKAFAGPHKILKSKGFSYPKQVEKGLGKLENIIERGGDITPYFNRTASDLGEYDDMFSDWGILHFHLGENMIAGEKLVERGKYVLFAYMKQNVVYLINVYDHKHWTDYAVIQEMYDSWPELLEPFIDRNILDVSFTPNKKELRKLRECGVVTFVRIKDENGKNTFLVPPGLGLNTARSSTLDSMNYMKWMKFLRSVEENIIKKESDIEKWMTIKNIPKKQDISLELSGFKGDKIELLDKTHDLTHTFQI